jgi:hypothetical protein
MEYNRSITHPVDLVKILNILKFRKVDIIGSYSDTKLKYFSDIDSQSIIKMPPNYKFIKEEFQDKISNILKNDFTFLLDFKAGFLHGKPIKWSPEEIFQGKKHIDGRTLKFEDILAQNSIIKIDVGMYQKKRDRFIEISTNYYFIYSNGSRTFEISDNETMKRRLLWDYQQLKNVNFYKSLKRLYSYFKFIKDEKSQRSLITIFNSPLGAVNKQIAALKTIVDLLETNSDIIPREWILNSVNQISETLKEFPRYSLPVIFTKFKGLTNAKILITIELEIEILIDKLNEASRDVYLE